MSPAPAVYLALAGWALAIAVWDAKRLRVPNALLVVVALPLFAMLVLIGRGPLEIGLREGAIAAALGFVPTFIGHLIRQVGAADVKYAALLGLLSGVAGILEILLIAALVTGLLSLAAWFESKRFRRPARRVPAALALSSAFVMFLAGRWPT